ncbi:hypothetical protein EGM70_16165 [Enterobacteriaceae bacterium 89]|jgi:hypothetical protein|nr:hypothetical protein [Enterobacteriaceae bacterium 89]
MSEQHVISEAELQEFIDISCELTGFSRFELSGTGQVNFYYQWVQKHAGKSLTALLQLYAERPEDARQRASFIEKQLMTSAALTPLVRSIIKLWYLGQWFDPNNPNKTEIPSANSYQQGLVWTAIHAHPQGAKQQGFGAWAEPPVMTSVVKL